MVDKIVLDTIENSLFDIYGPIEGFLITKHNKDYSHILFEDIDFWEFNRNRIKNNAAGRENEILRKIIDEYTSRDFESFSIVSGPLSSPEGLKDALIQNNFEFKEKGLGMMRSTSDPIEGDDTEFEIKEVDLDYLKTEEFCNMFEVSYGMPEGSGKLFYPLVKSMTTTSDVFTLVAFDKQKPIGVGVLVNVPNTPVCLFGGASTLQEYRGKGIYTTMMRRRVEKAKRLGNSHVVIQAKEDTSAPIASKYGFDKQYDLDFWVYNSDNSKY